jgi:hypothetical protein
MTQNLLLIDDTQAHLDELEKALQGVLAKKEGEIRKWVPSRGEDPKQRFDGLVDVETKLVVADYDLTKGQTGLFGSTIVAWCQARAIPVGDFSRANRIALPKAPNQYEIRVPDDPQDAAKYIAGAFRGFMRIRMALDSDEAVLQKKRSPVSVLASILGRSSEENRFALYGGRVGAANAALVDLVKGADVTKEQKRRLLCYVVGHLLLNVVLRFPGPLLNRKALAAYLAIAEGEISKVEKLFASAQYGGPFSDIEPYYWLSDVDTALEGMNKGLPAESSAETPGQSNREAVEGALGVKLARHACPRCDGVNGGFLCPFTGRTVCQLPTCSVGSNGWIPAGARLCRIEKDFYEEWAPMLGF